MKIPKILIISLLFACIGITTEVVFTAFSDLVVSGLENTPLDWSLTGKTYVWMFFIYALIPFLFKILNPIFSGKHYLFKVSLAVLIIYIVEFSSGMLLKLLLGACPWEYTTGMHIMGVIRLDYLPAWILFAALVISINQLLEDRISE